MSNVKVKIAVLKNLLIFDEKSLPQSVRLLEGGGVETLFGRIPFEHRSFLHGSSLTSFKICFLCDTSSPHNIVWRYIVMQLSYHFQNIVKISISLKFWKYHTILEKGYALWNSHFRSTLKAIHSVSCLQCASKIKITWLFAFVKTYLQHELAYFCHF